MWLFNLRVIIKCFQVKMQLQGLLNAEPVSHHGVLKVNSLWENYKFFFLRILTERQYTIILLVVIFNGRWGLCVLLFPFLKIPIFLQ